MISEHNDSLSPDNENKSDATNSAQAVRHTLLRTAITGNPKALTDLTDCLPAACENWNKLHRHEPLVKSLLVNLQCQAVPAVVFYTVVENSVYFYTVLIDSLRRQNSIVPDTVLINNEEITSPVVPSAMYDNDLIDIISTELVENDTGISESMVLLPTDHFVLPASAHERPPAHLAALLVDNAAIALYTLAGFVAPQKISGLISKGQSIVHSMDTTPGKTHNTLYGKPVAYDYATRTLIRQTQVQSDRRRRFHINSDEQDLAMTYAKLDWRFMPLQGIDNTINASPAYVPELIITHCSGITDKTNASNDLGSQLIGILSMAAYCDPTTRAWMSSVTSKHANNKAFAGLENFGYEWDALSGSVPASREPIKINYGVGSGTKSKHATPADIVKYYTHNATLISLDCEIGNDASYVQNVFRQAAALPDNTNAKSIENATAVICRAVDELTDGYFSAIWKEQANARMFNGYASTVLMGKYYDAESSEWRDIRDITRTKALELCKGDQSAMAGYTEYRNGIATKVSLQHLKNFLQGYVGDIEYTGIAERVTFHHDFLTAFGAAVVRANGNIALEGNNQSFAEQHAWQSYDPSIYGNIHIPAGLYQSRGHHDTGSAYVFGHRPINGVAGAWVANNYN